MSHLSSLSSSSSPLFDSSPSSTSSSPSQPSATFYCFIILAPLLFFILGLFETLFLLPIFCWSHHEIYHKLCIIFVTTRRTFLTATKSWTATITITWCHSTSTSSTTATKELFTYLWEHKEHDTLRRCWNLLTFMLLLFWRISAMNTVLVIEDLYISYIALHSVLHFFFSVKTRPNTCNTWHRCAQLVAYAFPWKSCLPS